MRRLLLLSAALAAMSAQADPPTIKSTDLDLTEVTIRVHWYDDARDIPRTEYRTTNAGLAVLKRRTDTGEYVCDVHVVRPRFIDSSKVSTVGHEVLHCLWGNYH
jgi:hypothetical protein